MLMVNRFVFGIPRSCELAKSMYYLQWWDKMDQVNRPHGWSFASITNGIIRDMKLWKPIAWNFNAAGSNNIHAFHNQIYALSDSDGFPFNT